MLYVFEFQLDSCLVGTGVERNKKRTYVKSQKIGSITAGQSRHNFDGCAVGVCDEIGRVDIIHALA